MNEFSLINHFFKEQAIQRDDVIFGIGDDAACLKILPGYELLVSTDTLVADVHFLSRWDPFDIAWKAVMVNVSDMAAMAATPCWLSLALTLPEFDEYWLKRFAQGLHKALSQFNIALIGGDTTRGPLSMTLTIQGVAPEGRAVRRTGAKSGDTIWISGELGAAAQAVAFLQREDINADDKATLLEKLQRPQARMDLAAVLQTYASAAIDISDGLSADLNHICQASEVGALLKKTDIPVHPLVKKYQKENAVNFALTGGDDYELCFTVPKKKHTEFISEIANNHIICYQIGVVEEKTGLRIADQDKVVDLIARGYSHF